jgi:hypothetical protein
MNSGKLQYWSVFAEIVGSLAVVVSLVFLVIEIDQGTRSTTENTRAIRAQTAQAALQQLLDFQNFVAEERRRGEMINRILNPEFSSFSTLTSEERRLAVNVTRRNLYVYDNAYYQYLQGTLDDSVFSRYRRAIEGRASRAWFKEYWDQEAFQFSDAFIDYVSELLGEDGTRHKERLASMPELLIE